ncbi:gamma-glutamyltransferase [Phenylobacterium sp. J367]|nr:gamma-glutamyltransferase [Phenylobacterium sp. J367]MCR5877488.1 gamma-glutamyltransferase [Phenylobacterium sp. J367]
MHGAAATAHPLATLAAIEMLKSGGSAVDAAIAANAVLGYAEPIACGIGGDCFVMLWDPKTRKVVGLNGSGRSPRGLSLETVRARATKAGMIPSHGAISVSVPGAVDAWWALHQRYGKLEWAHLFAPAIAHAEDGAPVTQNVAYYLERSQKNFTRSGSGIEEVQNFLSVWTKDFDGRTPREGEVFKNPALAWTYRQIAQGGGRAFYEGEIAARMDAYFKRIGGWMTRADLAAHRTEWVEPSSINYRGVDVWGLPPNSQGIATLQLLKILEQFDVKAMGFQSAAAIHHAVEAKRLAYEDRAKQYADPAFYKAPIEWLISADYAKERARLIRPDRILDPIYPGQAPSRGGHHLFHHRRRRRDDGVDHPVQLPRHGLGPDAGRAGVHAPGPRRALRAHRRAPQRLCAGEAAVPDDHPGVRDEGERPLAVVRGDGRGHAASRAGTDHLQHGGLRPGRAGGRGQPALAPRGRHGADGRAARREGRAPAGDRGAGEDPGGAGGAGLEAGGQRRRLRRLPGHRALAGALCGRDRNAQGRGGAGVLRPLLPSSRLSAPLRPG